MKNNLTRRTLLQRAAWTIAATALPRGRAWAAESVSPITTKLSMYMSEARDRVLPDDVTAKVKDHVLDTFAR